MNPLRRSLRTPSALLAGASALALTLLSGCGIGTPSTGAASASAIPQGSSNMGGILHGGPNPVAGATITLYTTTSAGYGATATSVATTTTGSDGSFNLTLPTSTIACPTGEYAYITAAGGTTGSSAVNNASLMMAPIGLCDANYTSTGAAGAYANVYTGSPIWLDELTTAVSAYALGNFMTVTNAGVVNIGAPANNHGKASASTPAAAGLAHAFQNALNIVNIHTGQPYGNLGGSLNTTAGIIPADEIFLLGNILQACVNSAGNTAASTATSNDGNACGQLFSFTVPPLSGAAVPVNTMQAMLDLAKYPAPALNTWNTACTAAGGGTTTATSCLFNLATGIGSYPNSLTAAPVDWSLAIVFPAGTGKNTTSTAPVCTGTGTSSCPGLTYPAYVALDYADNVYVLNWTGSTTTQTNIVGLGFDGTPIFASPADTTDILIKTIATDTAGHVIAANNDANANTATDVVKVYSATTGATLATLTTSNGLGSMPQSIIADPLNNLYIASSLTAINIRKATYGGTSAAPTYAVASLTTTAPTGGVLQLGWDSKLDLYLETSTPNAYLLPNTGTFAAPTYAANGITASSGGVTGSTGSNYGIAVASTGNAYTVTSAGLTPITKTVGSSTTIASGSPIPLPYILTSGGTTGPFDRYASMDGLNEVVTPDGANGTAPSGVVIYDTVNNISLGILRGCYVISRACGTTSAGQVPMYSARSAAIDSAGDVWVASGASATLTELIGAAAPTWPGLSMALSGRPQ
ncbi:hypothetical protein SAMN05421770_1123 [Granulicella rosea]|uniref:Uncharacterized protein n=1 Tax=Granulicella rosea TaxID=474952 RepID=A0A239MH02_9BACT|nr:hypothetical protein [Granulicella rosea]SNT41069.1 hypothetical protein SAMN05421770_1123 [Granulicella rosea]